MKFNGNTLAQKYSTQVYYTDNLYRCSFYLSSTDKPQLAQKAFALDFL